MTTLSVIETSTTLILDDEDGPVTLTVVEETIGLLAVAEQGPTGPMGDGSVMTMIAAASVSGHRAVIAGPTGVSHADPASPGHLGRVIGMTKDAAIAGAPVNVVTSRELVEPSWAFAPGPVWVGAGGVPTQTPPTTGFLQQIGVARDATRMIVQLGQPLKLA